MLIIARAGARWRWHDDAEWAELCGLLKRSTHLPVVYGGRVTAPEQAETITSSGSINPSVRNGRRPSDTAVA